MTQATKHDEGKPRFELLDPDFLEDMAIVLTQGAQEHGDFNYQKGTRWGRWYAAMLRHANAWWRGETLDHKSNKSHMVHVAVNAMFIYYQEKAKVGEDDRPSTRTTPTWVEARPPGVKGKDGWIEWEGLESLPFIGNPIVDVKVRNGGTVIGWRADQMDWTQKDHPYDITHYRVVSPT